MFPYTKRNASTRHGYTYTAHTTDILGHRGPGAPRCRRLRDAIAASPTRITAGPTIMYSGNPRRVPGRRPLGSSPLGSSSRGTSGAAVGAGRGALASVLVEQHEPAARALVLELVAPSATALALALELVARSAAALARVVQPAVSLAPVAVAPALQRVAQPAGQLVAARAQVLGPALALVRVAEPAAYLAVPSPLDQSPAAVLPAPAVALSPALRRVA
jgi:hypothetical protein